MQPETFLSPSMRSSRKKQQQLRNGRRQKIILFKPPFSDWLPLVNRRWSPILHFVSVHWHQIGNHMKCADCSRLNRLCLKKKEKRKNYFMQTSVLGDFTINSGGCWRSFVHFIQHSSFFRWGLSLKKQRGGKEIFLRASYIHTVGINRERAWYKSQSDKKKQKTLPALCL